MLRYDIELLRILSAFGIVWFHSGVPHGGDIGYSGLIFFIIASVYFSMQSKKSYTVYMRVNSLLIPCLLWAMIYGVIKVVMGKPLFPESNFLVGSLLTLTSIHLWYLPFIFFIHIVIDLIKNRVGRELLGTVSIIVALLILFNVHIWRELDHEVPFPQYLHGSAAVFIGLFFGCFNDVNKSLRVTFLGTLISLLMYYSHIGVTGVGVTYLIGVIASLLFLAKSTLFKLPPFILTISNATFGIYLIHVIFISLCKKIGVTGTLLPVCSFLVSLIVIIAIQQFLPKSITKKLV